MAAHSGSACVTRCRIASGEELVDRRQIQERYRMKFRVVRFMFLVGLASLAHAHFVFVVPNADGTAAKVFLSEDLKPANEVDVSLIGGTKLSVRDSGGRETPLPLTKEQGAYATVVPGSGVRIIHGVTDLGMMEHGQDKPSVLIYHPKTIVGDAFAHEQILGGGEPVEIVPVGKPGAVVLELLVHGKPQPDAELTVILPDGTQKTLRTNADGRTETLTATGRYGAWARYWEPVGGERDGKKYEQTRHYATLVFDAGSVTASRFGTLPEATASFGQIISDGWLYVYGGHIAHTHTYSTEAVSGRFERLNLTDGKTWEALPGGPGLQGMNLAAHKGKIYRVGGMSPRNKPGEKQALFSVADCARFDPATKTWEPLPSLPEPRSSHDLVVVGDQLIVVGGWNLLGPDGQKWADTLAVLDLTAEKLEWKSVPQPFRRRALIAAADANRMYVVGGFDDHGKIIREVAIYDSKTGEWSTGPALPGDEMNGFAPAACVHDGVLYVSVADGSLYRMDAAGKQWELLGASTPRLAHRIGFRDGSILIAGGAANGNNLDLIESIQVTPKRVP
jgi:hypothetical protein